MAPCRPFACADPGPPAYADVWISGNGRVVELTRGGFRQQSDGSYERVEQARDFLDLYLERLPGSIPPLTLDAVYDQAFIREELSVAPGTRAWAKA